MRWEGWGGALALQAGEGDGAHEVFLEDEEDDEGRDGDEDGAGHDGLVVGGAEAVGLAGSDEGEGQLFHLVADDEGPQVGVEGAEEDEDGERGEDRLGEGRTVLRSMPKSPLPSIFGGVVQPSILRPPDYQITYYLTTSASFIWVRFRMGIRFSVPPGD